MIIIVSGVPRSGTSLMMQMLDAGGVPVLTDGLREADQDNQRGYYEWEPAKRLPREPELIGEAEGKAVKVISSLVSALPDDHRYRVIFMQRPLREVLASQAEMIRRRGTVGAPLQMSALIAALEAHLKQVTAWLRTRPLIEVCWVDYHRLLQDPLAQVEKISDFLQVPLDRHAMARQVDPRLCHHRTPDG
jgi:hypothetical protein